MGARRGLLHGHRGPTRSPPRSDLRLGRLARSARHSVHRRRCGAGRLCRLGLDPRLEPPGGWGTLASGGPEPSRRTGIATGRLQERKAPCGARRHAEDDPGNSRLAGALQAGEVWCHPFVIGELACGNLRSRKEILVLWLRNWSASQMKAIPSLAVALVLATLGSERSPVSVCEEFSRDTRQIQPRWLRNYRRY